MVVRLRLARHGTRNNPFYHLVAIQNTKARDARPIEKLGEYDPVPRPVRQAPRTPVTHPRSEDRPGYNGEVIGSGIASAVRMEKRIEWNEQRIRYWLGTGAQPSKPVARLLDRVCVVFRLHGTLANALQAGLIPPEMRDRIKGLYRPPQPAAPGAPEAR